MQKALIVYGTKTGTAAVTAQEIAQALQNKGVETKVVDAKKEKIQSITEYDLIIVGSGIQMGRWNSEPENFIKKYKQELAQKNLALYVNCGSAAEKLNPEKPEIAANAKTKLENGFDLTNYDERTLNFAKEYSNSLLAIDVNIDVDSMLNIAWKLFDSHFKPAEVGIKEELVNKYWPKNN